MARVSARVIFVCRVVLGETLSVDWRERGTFGTNPLSRLRRQLFPFLSPTGDIFPRPGEVFRRESPWQRGQVSSSFVNGRKKSAVKLQTLLLCQSLSLSGEVARRSRDGEGHFRGEAVPERVIPPTAKKPACPLPFYGADKLAFVFLFRGRAYSSILPKPRPSKSSTRSVRLGATGSALAASRGA